MTYDEALSFIHSRDRFGSDLGLDRMRELMRLLGDPQKKLKFVHVAGTNGKGSTVKLISSVLTVQGYRTGTYISPFVERFNERMQLDLKPISDDDLADNVEKVKDAVNMLDSQGLFSPVTEFEAVTAAAFCWFFDVKCEYVVLEVGLGGRLDATNIIDSPLVSVITSISLDHTAILGNTLKKITEEKCGIIKDGRPVVLYPGQVREITETAEKTAAERHCDIMIPDLSFIQSVSVGKCGSQFEYKGLKIKLSLCGKFQIYNAVTVIETIFKLREQSVEISDESILKGLEKTLFFGRLFRLSDNVIFDGAHNPDGVDSLCDYIDSFIDGRLVVMMGILKDKDYAYCIKKIASRADVYCAVEPPNSRKLSADENEKEAHRYCSDTSGFTDIKDAVSYIKTVMDTGDTLLVCGSLYMLGEAELQVKKLLM